MINKNIFKILNEDKIKKIDGLKMNMRPSEIKQIYILKLLRSLRIIKKFIFTIFNNGFNLFKTYL